MGIQLAIDSIKQKIPANLKLQVNVDGLPLFKSSKVQLWPVLGHFVNLTSAPFVIGIYCGDKKPTNSNEFLSPFVNEFNSIQETLKHRNVVLTLHSFVCDAPAKAYIKCIKGHSGYHGCDKCTAVGSRIMNRTTFDTTSSALRTDQAFRNQVDEDHHLGRSILEEINGIDMVDSFALDYMHLICLGVMKKIMGIWLKGKPGDHKLSGIKIEALNSRISNIRRNMVAEFARKPREVNEYERWKATEFRQVLLYTGPVLFKNILSKDSYNHFMCLFTATRILSCEELNSTYNAYAKSLLAYFVKNFGALYGRETISYNVHNLLHIADDAKNLGVLDSFSAFCFENKLGKLKSLIRSPNKPLKQLIKRILERKGEFCLLESCNENDLELKRKHDFGPVPDDFVGHQFGSVVYKGYRLIVRDGKSENVIKDGYVLTKCRNLFLITNILQNEHQSLVLLYGKQFSNRLELFNFPCSSNTINVFKFKRDFNLAVIPLSAVYCKCQVLDVEEDFAVFPLLHKN